MRLPSILQQFLQEWGGGSTLNVNPNHLDERNIIVDAADRIIVLQHTNGAWDWDVTNQAGPTGTTYYNIEGVTAEVLIDAYRLTHDSKYLDAAKEAGDYIVATPISTSQRQNAFTINFLYHLTEISGVDAYSTKASQIFSHITSEVNYWSVNNGNHCADDSVAGCTASELIAAYKNYRSAETTPNGVVGWDLAPFVEAAELSENPAFANDVAVEINTYLSQPTYTETVDSYELGLSAGIKALNNVGMGYSTYLTKLLLKQDASGYFASPDYPNEKVQSTAYALMTLRAINNEKAMSSASYLANNFGYGSGPIDGWLEDTTEYSEVTSEAAQALFDYIYEEDTYYTIQDAINAAVEGGTINVAAGTYNERVIINKPLTLRGATYDINKNGYAVPADYGWDDSVESIINNPEPALSISQVVDIVSDDVIFEGFVVQSLNALTASANDHLLRLDASTGTANDGETIDTALDNIIIRNNIIGPNTNIISQIGTNGRMGLYFASPTYSNDETGITNTLVTGNKIFDMKGNGNNIFVWGAAKSYNSPQNADYSGTIIEDNEIYGSHRSGIEIAGGVNGLIIRDNKIYENNGLSTDDPNKLTYGNGIVVIRMGSDKTFSTAMGPVSVTIENNEIYDNEKNGIYMGPINSGHTISGNTIYGNGWDGLRVDLTEQYHSGALSVYDKTSNILVNNNKIYGNGAGASLIGDPTNGFILDATENYWSTSVKSTIQSKVSGDVNFEPYYVDAAKTILSSTPPATVYVDDEYSEEDADDHYFGYNAFSTIQEGINAVASGGTVNVAAGTYPESVLTEKTLTLTSDSEEKPAITGSAGHNYIVKITADNVMLNNFEVNGGGSGTDSNAFDYGIWVTGTDNIEIKSSVVKNVWKTSGNGIQVDDSTNSNIHNNQISSFHKRGIRYVHSSGEFYSNEITGDNVDGTSRVQNLVNLWTGSDVEIYNNVLHNALTTPGITPTWDSPGIFVSSYYGSYPNSGSSHADIHDNEIYDGDSGIIVGSYYSTTDASSADIINNNLHNLNWAINFEKGTVSATVTNNKFSNVNKAVNADDGNGGPATKPVVDAKNNYWGSVTPDFGTLLYDSVSHTPWYIDSELTMLISEAPAEDQALADSEDVIVKEGKTDIVVPAGSPVQNIEIPDTVDDDTQVTLDLSSSVVDTGTEKTVTLANDLTLSRDTSTAIDYEVEIPAGITVSGPTDWTGVINIPTVQATSSVTPTADAGTTASVATVVEVGFGDTKLTFDKAVRLLITGQAGKLAGYSRGGVFTKITTTCTDNTQATNDLLPADTECKIDVGSDMVIWTRHFTEFVAYTQTQNTPASSGGGGHSGSGSNCAYSCAAWGACVNGKQTRTCTPNIYCDENDLNKALTERTCSTTEENMPLGGKSVETTPIESEQGNQPVQETGNQGGNTLTGRTITETLGLGAHPWLAGILIIAIIGGLGTFVYLKYLKKP